MKKYCKYCGDKLIEESTDTFCEETGKKRVIKRCPKRCWEVNEFSYFKALPVIQEYQYPCMFDNIEPGTPMLLHCTCPRCSPRF